MGKKTGVTGSKQYLSPLLHSSLYKIAMNLPPEPKPVKIEPGRKGKVTIPNEVVLEMRRMYEKENKSYREVCQKFPELDPQYVRRILEYVLRSNLKP